MRIIKQADLGRTRRRISMYACAAAAVFGLLSAEARAQPFAARAWVPTGGLNAGRAVHTATLMRDGSVLVTGGFASVSSAELYDQKSGSWTVTGGLQLHRIQDHTATLLPNGMVLVAAGLGCEPGKVCEPTASAEVYDPQTGMWATTGSLNVARAGHTGTLLPNGLVLVAGWLGLGGPPAPLVSSAELYDPRTGTWTNTGSLNTPRAGHTATLLHDGRVLVAGGYPYSTSSAELYDSRTGTWSNTGNMNASRALHTATLLHNGAVLVVGGAAGPGFPSTLASAEIFDPRSGTWIKVGNMNTARYVHTATLLPNGMVLVAGGSNVFLPFPTLSLASTELYDPRTATWTSADSMNSARSQHTATALRNGVILVSGGWTTMSTAELFQR